MIILLVIPEMYESSCSLHRNILGNRKASSARGTDSSQQPVVSEPLSVFST